MSVDITVVEIAQRKDENITSFPLRYLRYCDVYRHESGRCYFLSFFLTFYIILFFPGFPFFTNILIYLIDKGLYLIYYVPTF
jgi:hypothetical protein